MHAAVSLVESKIDSQSVLHDSQSNAVYGRELGGLRPLNGASFSQIRSYRARTLTSSSRRRGGNIEFPESDATCRLLATTIRPLSTSASYVGRLVRSSTSSSNVNTGSSSIVQRSLEHASDVDDSAADGAGGTADSAADGAAEGAVENAPNPSFTTAVAVPSEFSKSASY